MMRLFAGYMGAHGTHGVTSRSESKGGKLEIKKSARTVREPVTEELWEAHLSGEKPLGIIPISEEQTCVWGCIDVDKYDINLADTVKRLRSMKLPLIVCRSKSGGAHLFLFLSEPVPAEQIRAHLRQIAASLGWGDCEIFPKQNQIISDRGDLGNWLNMPYLGGDRTERYAVKETMGGMTLGEFLALAESSRGELGRARPVREEHQDETLDDGPPCLQHLSAVGFPDGSRNNGLFGLGIFCKKKFGSKWKEMLEKYNREFMKPPLDSEEVLETIRNLEKKDYNYKCKDAPLVSYCNSTLCRTRKFGVGGGGMYPVVSGLSKLDTEPPIWFLDIEDHRIELSTRELVNYRDFQLACAEKITTMFMNMKPDTWNVMIGEAMQNANIIEAPPEASTLGHFLEELREFCVNRHVGQSKEDLFLGKPWLDEEGGRHYFRLRDLMDHLQRQKFTIWGRNTVAQRLLELGGKQFFNIKGDGLSVFWVRSDMFKTDPDLELPASVRDPI